MNAGRLLMHLQHTQGTFSVDQPQKQIQHQGPEGSNMFLLGTACPHPRTSLQPTGPSQQCHSTTGLQPFTAQPWASLASPCSQGGDGYPGPGLSLCPWLPHSRPGWEGPWLPGLPGGPNTLCTPFPEICQPSSTLTQK